jgi:hypothetical protein
MALLIAGAVAAAGCSDDDAQGSSTTTASSAAPASTTDTTLAATTSAPPTSSATTPSTTDTPTTPEPTTEPVDVEALKAEIARDYERAYQRRARMLADPSLRRVEQRVSTVLAPGSAAYNTFVDRIRELVALGDAVVPNDPNLYSATVEKVQLLGEPPYRRAIVTVCEVDNRKQVTLPESSPTGNEILVAGTGTLEVIRYREPVRRTEHGWLRYRSPRKGTGFDGETTCPPA